MKKFLLVLTIILLGSVSKGVAQKNLVATLNHDGEISTYFGSQALRSAYGAAAEGDIITLSSGTFTSPAFTKAVIIRGAGMEGDEVTTIAYNNAGDNFIRNLSNANTNLVFEGIYFSYNVGTNLERAYLAYPIVNTIFKKCKMESLYVYKGSNFTMIDSKITNCIDMTAWGSNYYYENCNVSCINCIVKDPYKESDNSSFNFVNCIVYISGSFVGSDSSYGKNSSVSKLTSSLFENSFVIVKNTTSFPETSMVESSNILISDYSAFKTFTGTWSDDENFELTDEAKANYIGSDGKEMGIHGGMYPWSTPLSYPQITKFDVAKKATADGKLSVDIVVNGTE